VPDTGHNRVDSVVISQSQSDSRPQMKLVSLERGDASHQSILNYAASVTRGESAQRLLGYHTHPHTLYVVPKKRPDPSRSRQVLLDKSPSKP